MGGPGEGIPGAPTPESGMQGYVESCSRADHVEEWMQSFYAYVESMDSALQGILVAVQRIHWDWAGGIIKKRLVTQVFRLPLGLAASIVCPFIFIPGTLWRSDSESSKKISQSGPQAICKNAADCISGKRW